MSEKLSTRREASSAEFENSPEFRAIKTLTKIGFLTEMDQLDLYHGRSGVHGENWHVESNFDNSGNKTGHRNINKTPALNTSSIDVAKAFAEKRTVDRSRRPEIHKIVSEDPDARIIDLYFEPKDLEGNSRNEYLAAVRQTLPTITGGVPVDFAHRNSLQGLAPSDLSGHRDGLIYSSQLAENSQKFQLEPEFNRSISAATNTRTLLGTRPEYLRPLLFAYMDGQDAISVRSENGQLESVPISKEYLNTWFRSIHTVGCKMRVRSATIRQPIDNYLLFDLDKVNTEEFNRNRERFRDRRFGQIALAAERSTEAGSLSEALSKNHYIKPQEIVNLAKKTPNYQRIFESDAGNWEKFTLEEHTETVLRLFDDNYADLLPASTLPVMRLALLVHDLGKPAAVQNNDKKHQREYNLMYAQDFMRQNHISAPEQKLVLAMIGEGMNYASKRLINQDRTISPEYRRFCKNTISEYLGKKWVSDEDVKGFRDMIEVLQTCDSAAYTTMAITRSAKTGIQYRNHPSFNRSFEENHGLTGKRARLRRTEI